MKNTILILAALFIFPSCKQNNNPKPEKMSNLTSTNYIETMLKSIKRYNYEPMYYLTFEQSACFSEILVNDIPLHKNFQKEVSGRTLDINNYIFKSGIQKITFRLYPAGKIDGRDLSKLVYDTEMKIEISESDNNKRDQAGKTIMNYATPTVVNTNVYGEKEFLSNGKTYYEASFTFEAKVPYEFPSLDNGQDLREWNQEKLEKKVVDFYKTQLTLLKEKKKEEYFSYLDLKEKETRQSLFFNEKELREILDLYLDPFTIPNYQMQPLENYKLKFYGNGKIVCLELNSLDNNFRGESALWAIFDEGDGEMLDFFKFYLYIPEGEDELVMIR
ncbi:hypothetical protein [Flavobacterium sp. LM4]|uniref:hypothetical protein n=1 Tax=Flavobacterium sp. LM4 TaxID=1938609 RepID=UPI0009922702|nr:hypothetical protein [Flavobacterium sp. LM4]OOV16611.1 hypothetical protein BXU10_20895 [Flavobacterium sp. LM4]